jgi:hypothetical protein
MAVMREVGERLPGIRLRGLIVVLWRAGLRISEARALAEGDLEPSRGAMLVRRGKGGRRREVGMDEWGWQQLRPWLEHRVGLPVGPLFCVLKGPTAGQPWSAPSVRTQLRRMAVKARGAAALRAAPAPPRPRSGDGARGSVAERDPAPARSRQPRHHLHLSGGDRLRRDHRDGSRPACAVDPGGDGAPPLARPTGGRRTIPGRRPLVIQRGSHSPRSTHPGECWRHAKGLARPRPVARRAAPHRFRPR